MMGPTSTDHDRPAAADRQRAAYEWALVSYTDAVDHADRMESLQRGEPMERQDPLVWRYQERAWRALDHAPNALIATAPARPTRWWPGGWSAVSTHLRYGLRCLPGQVARTNIWRTQGEAHARRPDFIPADEWAVSWTPAGRNEFRTNIPLDATFWATNEATTT